MSYDWYHNGADAKGSGVMGPYFDQYVAYGHKHKLVTHSHLNFSPNYFFSNVKVYWRWLVVPGRVEPIPAENAKPPRFGVRPRFPIRRVPLLRSRLRLRRIR